jgi:hypothetical protein
VSTLAPPPSHPSLGTRSCGGRNPYSRPAGASDTIGPDGRGVRDRTVLGLASPDPLTSRTPTDPMTNGRPHRTARLLTAWTMLLLGLVLVEIRHLPPVLAALLVPYLALMTWHGVSGLRRRVPITIRRRSGQRGWLSWDG